MNFFRIDSPIYNGLSRICDILILNVLWVICSVPIITTGAATTALYYSLLKITRERDSSITGMFFHSFRQNFKQGCGMTVLFALSGFVIYADIQLCKILDGMLCNISMTVLILLLIIWGMVLSYAFPILAQFENTIRNTIKNAFIISISNFGKTLIIVFLNAVPIIFFLGMPSVFMVSLPIWVLWGFALIAFINAKMFVKIFDNYIGERNDRK